MAELTPQDAQMFQNIYEQVLGLPTAGRDLYSSWLANRWQDAVSQWGLATTPEFAFSNDPDRGRFGDPINIGFREWLESVKGTPEMFGAVGDVGAGNLMNRISLIANAAGGRGADRLREIGDRLSQRGAGGALDYVLRRNLENRFGRLGGRALYEQETSPEAQRAFALEERQGQNRFDPATGELIPFADTFLTRRLANLRKRYGF